MAITIEQGTSQVSAPAPGPTVAKKRVFPWFRGTAKQSQVAPGAEGKRRWFPTFTRKPKQVGDGSVKQVATRPAKQVVTRPVASPATSQPITITVGRIGKSILHFTWTKALLYWIIITAGTMAECVFLVASLWISINASVHSFVLLFMPQDMTVHISEFANTAYVGLPECILGLAFVITLSHFRVWWSDKANGSALTWCILYALPTGVFLCLSVITLGSSVAFTTFLLPTPLIVARALAGYFFGFIAFLYSQMGIPQEAGRLQAKDNVIAELRTTTETVKQEHAGTIAAIQAEHASKTATLLAELSAIQRELTVQKDLISANKNALVAAEKALNKSDSTALGAYSQECKNWLSSGEKSFFIDEITQYTGISKRRIGNAIERKELKTPTSSKTKVEIHSLIHWLKKQPEYERNTDATP